MISAIQDEQMDEKISAELDAYHERLHEEQNHGPDGVPAGEQGDWLDRRLLAVGPKTGQLINILVRNLQAPIIFELGTS